MRAFAAFAALAMLGGCGPGAAPGKDAGQEPAEANRSAAAQPPHPIAPPPEPPSRPMSPTGYALVGTDPPWGGTLVGTRLRYMTPERQFGDVVETRVRYDPATRSETYEGRFRGAPLVLRIVSTPCSDGVSQQTYAFHVTLLVQGEMRSGCADPEVGE